MTSRAGLVALKLAIKSGEVQFTAHARLRMSPLGVNDRAVVDELKSAADAGDVHVNRKHPTSRSVSSPWRPSRSLHRESSSSLSSTRSERAMKCPTCRQAEIEILREARPADRFLPDVIADGLTHGTCPHCGETMTGFPRPLEMFALVTRAILAKGWRLAPSEVRYLRSVLAMKGEALAETLGVTATQLSRWENGAAKGARTVQISPTADRLLRVLVANARGIDAPALRGIDGSHSEPLRLRLELGKRWRVVETAGKALVG